VAQDRETLDATLDAPAGTHEIRARSELGGDRIPLSDQQFLDLITVHVADFIEQVFVTWLQGRTRAAVVRTVAMKTSVQSRNMKTAITRSHAQRPDDSCCTICTAIAQEVCGVTSSHDGTNPCVEELAQSCRLLRTCMPRSLTRWLTGRWSGRLPRQTCGTAGALATHGDIVVARTGAWLKS
jgi:hypothetical protein